MSIENWSQVKEHFQAALELAPEKRAAYLDQACAADPSVRAEVESLLRSHEEAGELLETPALHLAETNEEEKDFRLGTQIGPYQLIARIGQGGMGTVYRAVRIDDHYLKQVAIKVLRAGFNSEQHVRRFKNERQIMASMDHPNITRLLDGGTTKEGLPYFVMEYIEGKRIDEYCDERNLTTMERLRLFRKVCSAVQYAHQHLVVHRDLKPANILITEAGVPQLLDFGIAKLLDPELFLQTAELTAPLSKPMTPEYASPEQIRGEPITTVSDVYSLGVLLYRLLTGHAPYRVDGRQLYKWTQAITETEPEKPSVVIHKAEEETGLSGEIVKLTPQLVSHRRGEQPEALRRTLSGDLDNIVLKALRKEPSRRYVSVEQFSEDIALHIRGLPILARTDTFRYRTGKFVRRHKRGVAAAVLVLLTLLAGVATTGWQAHVARAEEARAERRFNDVHELANSLIFDMDDAIADLPGSTPARKILVSNSVKYLDTLAQEAKGDRALQSDLAAAYQKLGDVQGNPFRGNIGDTQGALQSYRKAVNIRETLAAADAKNQEAKYALAVSYRLFGRLLVTTGDLSGGLQYARKAQATMEGVTIGAAENPKFLDELENAYELVGDIQGGNGQSANLGDIAGALENHGRALAIAEMLRKKHPDDIGMRRAVAIYDIKMADDLIRTDERAGALKNYRAALEIYKTFDPNSTSVRRESSFLQARIGDMLAADGDAAGSVAAYRIAVSAAESLAAADPQNALARQDIAEDYVSLGRVLLTAGDPKESFALTAKGTAMLEKEVALDPKNVDITRTLALVYVWNGEALLAQHRPAEALKVLRKGAALFESLAASDANDIDLRLSIVATHAEIGNVLLAMGSSAAAQDEFQKALSQLKASAASKPPNLAALYSVASLYSGLGQAASPRNPAALTTGQQIAAWTQARSWFQKSAAAWQQIRNPGKLTPSGFRAGDPKAAEEGLANAEAALLVLRR